MLRSIPDWYPAGNPMVLRRTASVNRQRVQRDSSGSPEHLLVPAYVWRHLSPIGPRNCTVSARLRHLCSLLRSGVTRQPLRGPKVAKIVQRFSLGNCRRRERRIGAATAIEWPPVRTLPFDAVSSTMTAGSSGAPSRRIGGSVGSGAAGNARWSRQARRLLHRQAIASAIGNADGERGAKRPRGRRRRAADVRTRNRAAPPPPVAGDDDAARETRSRPRGRRGCRAAAPCRRGSR